MLPATPQTSITDRYRHAAATWPVIPAPSYERLATLLSGLHEAADAARCSAGCGDLVRRLLTRRWPAESPGSAPMTEPQMLRAGVGGVGTVRGLAGVMTRLKVRLRREALDAALAEGRNPWSHPELMVRATPAHLVGPAAQHRYRHRRARHARRAAPAGIAASFGAPRRRASAPRGAAVHRRALRDPSPAPVHVVAQLTVLVSRRVQPGLQRRTSGGRPGPDHVALPPRAHHRMTCPGRGQDEASAAWSPSPASPTA